MDYGTKGFLLSQSRPIPSIVALGLHLLPIPLPKIQVNLTLNLRRRRFSLLVVGFGTYWNHLSQRELTPTWSHSADHMRPVPAVPGTQLPFSHGNSPWRTGESVGSTWLGQRWKPWSLVRRQKWDYGVRRDICQGEKLLSMGHPYCFPTQHISNTSISTRQGLPPRKQASLHRSTVMSIHPVVRPPVPQLTLELTIEQSFSIQHFLVVLLNRLR